ncbi:MAG: hypothetical protein A3A43_01340 [Candidatus Liptonbacteria bacterium RIFCSPLOWO2_01_FULL_56_20]|uniref:ABC transporter domain-containing protein n=1 Tax=Candidatus Liptonbacteria bacterium RIFCSPLOWO2_01_FULL_56_20 TaxID=1798652 RepID=A0A1G2CM12_9BACT|nr:MAG: ABC transporter related protein [Parcubacteria group bacterium GW2011_GWB1_56_8]OGY98447.1 MAG: hypothetical protein A2681_01425 [Candidatus Liptonbacteria bacterium RIFCSPHIGHO2_01_FULL_56_18b]OGZ01681.1 MAG: hypothetical protein A3A43_01340 [Candidatus Liptonbacteria bacterium RIFCSPLOWO2_01_FULL_56_20]
MGMAKILEVKDLSVSFDDTQVIRDLNFTLDEGDHLAIIGPNGSGKTVLLRALLNIVPYQGDILWRPGIRLGYVPQKIDADRHLPLTMENLLLAKARVLRLTSSAVAHVKQTLGLTEALIKTPVGHLSGGQFQKALIAFALLGSPNVILFDEPTASLDQLTEEHVYELVDELRKQHRITMILVSHELSVVSRFATTVLCLNKEAVCYGPPKEVLNPRVLEKLYGTPQKFHTHGHAHGRPRHGV